jgi:hypothetical protein
MQKSKPILAVLRVAILLVAVCLLASGCKKAAPGKPKDPAPVMAGIKLVELDLEIDAVTAATSRDSIEDISPPHLRKYNKDEKRKPFMVIEGLENLAMFKPVTSSDAPDTGEIEQINDGIMSSEGFDFVEGPGWVQVDLEESASIHAIVLWHYHKSVVIFNDIIVQISDDADFTQNVRTLFNNDHDNSAGMGKGSDTAYISSGWGEIVDARDANLQAATARYIRVYTNKSTDGLQPRYVEVAIYGTPPQTK